MVFSVNTVYNKERLLRYNDFVSIRKRFFWTLIIVCSVLIYSVFIFDRVMHFDNAVILFCFFMTVALDFIIVFSTFILPRITIKKSLSLNAQITSEFGEESFKITASTPLTSESMDVKYSALVKVMESDKDIYLFISRQKAYVLDKDGFTLGTPKGLVDFLVSKNIPYKK